MYSSEKICNCLPDSYIIDKFFLVFWQSKYDEIYFMCKLDLESREREGAKSRRPMKLPFEILLCLNFNYIGSIHVNEFGSIG